MNKAEEFLKEKHNDTYNYIVALVPNIKDAVCIALEQYAQQVRREEMEQAFKAGMIFQQIDGTRDFDEWYFVHQNQER